MGREEWRSVVWRRTQREQAEDYLLGLLQAGLQPADLLLVLLLQLVHLLVVGGHLLLQRSLQGRQLSLPPPQHLLQLLPGQELLLQLRSQLHQVLEETSHRESEHRKIETAKDCTICTI